MGFVEDVKQAQRRTWQAGDWPAIAVQIQSASDVALDRLAVEKGTTLLDVACGNGNVAVPAAERGAQVVAVDLVPDLLAYGRERAIAAGVDAGVTFVEGDAEDLPVDDDAFDHVVSVFGVMFAPRHDVAARELVRATRPGGRIVVVAWTPDGLIGSMFRTVGSRMPPPPPEFVPPAMWGVEEHVRSLFDGPGLAVACERNAVVFEDASAEEWFVRAEEDLGPLVLAKAALEPTGAWAGLRADLVDLHASFGEPADDGGLRAVAEYLVTTVDVAG